MELKDTTRLVSVDDVLYFQALDKYTEVVTAGERHVIRTPLKELLQRLDPDRFARVHRGVIVAYAAIDRIERDLLARLRIHLRGHRDVLPVSRAYAGCSSTCDARGEPGGGRARLRTRRPSRRAPPMRMALACAAAAA
ncbi:hypothetical protein BMMON3_18070 [Burkholderia mallei]